MRIINALFSKKLGGIETAFVNYTKALLLKNHDVHVIVHPQFPLKKDLEDLGIPIYYLKNWGQWDVFAKLKIGRLLEKINPDRILAHANRATTLLSHKRTRKRTLPIVQNYSFKRSLAYPRIITTTQLLKTAILSTSNKNNEVFILPNMVAIPQIQTSPPNDIPVIGSLGRFVEKKGFDLFIEALSILKNKGVTFKALLAGQGSEEHKLKALAQKKGLEDRLRFPGWMAPSDFFKQLDLFCLPSRHEPFGIVLIEAFAHQVPVISTPSEGPSEIGKEGETVLFTPFGDPSAMAEKMEELLGDVEKRKALSDRGFRKALKTYSLPAIAEILDQILHEM